MASLMSLLSGNVLNEIVKGVSGNLKIPKGKASIVVAAALPLLLQALAKNTSTKKGATSLFKAIEEDHDGSILNNIGGFLKGQDESEGEGILKHVLGGRQKTVETGLAKISGLDASQAGSVIAMMAPVVLGALSKQTQKDGLDSAGLASLIGSEQKELAGKQDDAMGVLGKLLDSGSDGSVVDSAIDIGASLLKKFF